MKQIAAVSLASLAVALIAVVAYAQHSVLLSWTASTDAASNPSLTYNVYRSTSCSGTFALLNTGVVAATTFSDSDVFDRSTYCYQVTAVLSGAESVPSSQATAVIPAAPASPTAPASSSTSVTAPKSNCTRHGTLADWLRCMASLPRNHK